ncbi:MAG: tyrosine recombinase XerC [Candidatus Improbicoccus devescovinae]|nr:MAG: tyrosine recombinase XerC [Candidatus Improbicoccus devescovinae]
MSIWSESPEIIRNFLVYLKNVKNKSDKTISEYFFDLRTFFRYYSVRDNLNIVKNDQKFAEICINYVNLYVIKKINNIEILEYINFLSQYRANKASTRARKISSLKSFFRYLSQNLELINKNPVENIESTKIKKSLPKFLDLDQCKQLLESVKNISSKNALRDYCIILFFLNCGMRLSELVGININDINSDGSVRILGKGNKERIIYLPTSCLEALENYKHVRNIATGKDKYALFTSRNRRRLSVKTVQFFIKKYFMISGLSSYNFSVHKLRHTAATLMYQHSNVDIKILKEILGHENIATTEIYTHTSSKFVKEALESNPLAKLKIN